MVLDDDDDPLHLRTTNVSFFFIIVVETRSLRGPSLVLSSPFAPLA